MTGPQQGQTSPWTVIVVALVLVALAGVLSAFYITSARSSPVEAFQLATPGQLDDVQRILGRDRLPAGFEPVLGPSVAESVKTGQITAKVLERAGGVGDGRVLLLSRLGHSFGGEMIQDAVAESGLHASNLEYLMTDVVSLDLGSKLSETVEPGDFGLGLAIVHPGTVEFDGRRFEGDIAFVFTACKHGGGFAAVYHSGESIDAASAFDPVYEFAAPCLPR